MNKRYLEVYSARRDRNKYPFISQFEIPLEQTGLRNTSQTALDPVILAMPFYEFELNTAGTETPYPPFVGPLTFNGGSALSPILDASSSSVNNYYNGFKIIDISISPYQIRTIKSYNGTSKVAILDSPFVGWNPADTYYLTCANGGDTLEGGSEGPLIFSGGDNINPRLNLSSVNIPNYYKDSIITDLTLNEKRIIISYNNVNKEVVLDSPFSIGWNATNNYTITWKYHFNGGSDGNPLGIILDPHSVGLNNYYLNYQITDTSIIPYESRLITSYNGATKTAILDAAFSNPGTTNHIYTLGKTYFFAGGTPSKPQLDPDSADALNDNFYIGYSITDITLNPPQSRIITSYTGSSQTCTLSAPFATPSIVGHRYIIRDPSIPIETIVSGSISGTNINPVVSILTVSPQPNFAADCFPDGYFSENYVQILDNNGVVLEERNIQDFINVKNMGVNTNSYILYLNNHFTPSLFSLATSFKIVVPPYQFVQLQPVGSYNFKNPANAGQYFTGDIVYFERTGEYKTITSYLADFRYGILDSGFKTFDPILDYNATFTLRQDIPQARGIFPNDNNTATTLFLDPLTSPSTNDTWNGFYIYIKPLGKAFTDIPSNKNVYRIERYYGANPPPSKTAYSIEINGSITGIPIPKAGQGYEILVFSYDNFVPFSYNGSTVSQNQETCYEITLLSLVLPNLVLKSGSRISYYPYLYVEFGTYKTANNHSNQIIYSNNPNSGRALFITPITDISNPNSTQFIKLDSSNMTQTVKFKPNDPLVFSVYLPNGELFITEIPDDYSPYPPRPEIQIEAVFSLKRL